MSGFARHIALELSNDPAALDTLAEALRDRICPPATEIEPWIGVEEAAEHLACPKSRVYSLVSAGRIPHQKDGSRLLFKRSELDGWIAGGGGTRP